MKLLLLFAVFLATAASAQAQSVQDDLAALEKRRAAEVARATDTINRSYLREYENLLQRANLVGDAQGVNLVRAMIRKLSPEPEATSSTDKKPSTDPIIVLTSNHWMDETLAQDGRHFFHSRAFLPDGQMTSTSPQQSGTWKIVNNELVIELSAHPNAVEKFFLPPQLVKWQGLEKDGSHHHLSVDKPGEMPAPTGKPDYPGRAAP